MFNGGMGMTKPGAPVASGILASSQPLVDVLANQARDNLTNGINVGSQMYGSNVQGTNLMNQGGVVNYNTGGIRYTTNEAGDVVRIPVSGSQEEAEIVENEGLGMFAGLPEDQFKRSDAPGTAFGRALQQGEASVEYAWREHIAKGGDGSTPLVLEDGTIIVGNPDGSGGQLYAKGRGSGQDIYEVPLEPGLTKENIGLLERPNVNIRGFPGDPDVVEKLDSEGQPIVEAEVIEQEKIPVEDVVEQMEKIQSSKKDLADMIESGSTDTNVNVEKTFGLKEGDPYNFKNKDIYAAFGADAIDETKEKVIVKEKDKKESKSDAEEIITKETTTEETAPDDPYDFTDKDLYDAFDANIVDDVRANANANDEKTTEEKMAAFKEEFKNAMPEYQGMSDEEKGNAWIKMGMAVAAGQSANAITNIANGVLATIDEFADDPKQKREYEMKVALAGSKYALQRLNEERVKLEGLDKEGRTLLDYVTSTPFTFNGKEYAKGDPFQITRSQFDEGILAQLPAGAIVQPAIFKDMENTLQAIQDFEATKLGSGAKMSDWITERDKYTNTLGDMKSGINMRLYLGQAADLLNNGDVLGAKGIVLSGFDQALNFLGLDQGQLNTLRSKDKQAYNQKMKEVGTQMLTQILGETNRTISDNDRKLVNELTALIGDYKATGLNLDVINEKILSIDRKIQEDLQLNTIKLQGIESTWSKGTKVKDSPVIPFIELQRARKSQFPTQKGRATSAGTQKIFKYEDIWDTKNNVFKRGIEWE